MSHSRLVWKRKREGEGAALRCGGCGRGLLADAVGDHVVLADGAGGVEVQRHVELVAIGQPHGQARAQLLRLARVIAEFGHPSTTSLQGYLFDTVGTMRHSMECTDITRAACSQNYRRCCLKSTPTLSCVEMMEDLAE